MVIIRNNLIPFKGYKILNLFGILFVRKDEMVDDIDINHERIHTAQMLEMLVVFFYLWYVVEYIIIRMFHRKQGDAYHDVSFEEEAYRNEIDFSYLYHRNYYAWIKYVRINKD